MLNVKNCVWIKCNHLLHTYNIARCHTGCKRLKHSVTCGTDALRMKTISIPLASLARVMLCITVNILYYNRKFAKRARSASGLMYILTWGHGGIMIIILNCYAFRHFCHFFSFLSIFTALSRETHSCAFDCNLINFFSAFSIQYNRDGK